jgi:dipeptidyl aminopeptidase/acylaminoacyl peptidase
MTTNRFLPLCAVLAATFLTTASSLRAADPTPPPPPQGAAIPIEHFFADAAMRSLQLSPDGRHLAFRTTLGTGHIGIAMMDLQTGQTEALVAMKDENIKLYFWKGNDRIVFGGDIGGNESLSLRAINLKTRNVIALAESYKEIGAENANQARIIDNLKLDPKHILIQGNKDVGSYNFGIFLMDVRTGDRTKMQGADVVGARGLFADNAGVVRALDRKVENTMIHELRLDGKSTFFKVGETPADVAIEEPTWQPLAFAADNETLYVLTRDDSQRRHLRAYYVPDRAFRPDLDYVLEGAYDSIVLSPDRTKLLGVYYTTDRTMVHWFDADRANLQAKIDGALPDTLNRSNSVSDDSQLRVIFSTSDRAPGTYYLLNLDNPKHGLPAIMMLGQVNPDLSPAQLQPMQSVSYAARDGRIIHGYLTLPAGAQGHRVPLIINPHGGPFGIRDEWGFNEEVQFMASRGYAVLQPNYRGSGGYGLDHLLAGRHEWGGKMQDDLTDGVKWAIAQGFADPDRVAIVGASYGGYAALAGVTFTPELYRCAVNYVGVSDLSIIAGYGEGHGRIGGIDRTFQKKWIGDDAQYLHDHSPVNYVQNIRVPTMHAYGENDPRVDIDHWRRLKSELDRYNKTYEYVREGEEGHGFAHESARISFYRRVEDFLARNLAAPGQVKVGPTQVIDMPAKGTD